MYFTSKCYQNYITISEERQGGIEYLNEHNPHRLMYLNTCCPFGGTVWDGLECVALLENVSHRG